MFIVVGCGAWQVDTRGSLTPPNVIVHLVSPKPWMVVRSMGLCQVNGTSRNQEQAGSLAFPLLSFGFSKTLDGCQLVMCIVHRGWLGHWVTNPPLPLPLVIWFLHNLDTKINNPHEVLPQGLSYSVRRSNSPLFS